MSSGSDSDSTESNMSSEKFDTWMNGSSQDVQKYNMELFSSIRKANSPLQRIHSGVKSEIFSHCKLSTFRPSPLDTEPNRESTPKQRSACISTTKSDELVTKSGDNISPVPFAKLSFDNNSHFKKEPSTQDTENNGVTFILEEIKKIKLGQELLVETQEKILASQTVFYGLISDLIKTYPSKENIESKVTSSNENTKDQNNLTATKNKMYVPSEVLVARLHQKLTKDELINLVFEAGFERPKKNDFTKDQLIKMLFPHLENIFG